MPASHISITFQSALTEEATEDTEARCAAEIRIGGKTRLVTTEGASIREARERVTKLALDLFERMERDGVPEKAKRTKTATG